ncbi:MAG: undecaprenyl-diphosphate phosphatase, partial [Pyramidobacter sp.]|nr:undecaprenyl-diphosphate phosphatase [Pyramidobacter sp.]
VSGAALLELRHFDGALPAGWAAAMALAFLFGVVSLCLVHRAVVSGRWRIFAVYCVAVGLAVIFFL